MSELPARILPGARLWRLVESSGSESTWSEGMAEAIWLCPNGAMQCRVTFAVSNKMISFEVALDELLKEAEAGTLRLSAPDAAAPAAPPTARPLPAAPPAARYEPAAAAPAGAPAESPSVRLPGSLAAPRPKSKAASESPTTPSFGVAALKESLTPPLGPPPPCGVWKGEVTCGGTDPLTAAFTQLHTGPPYVSAALAADERLRVTRLVSETHLSEAPGAARLLCWASLGPVAAALALETELLAGEAAAVLESAGGSSGGAKRDYLFLLPRRGAVGRQLASALAAPAAPPADARFMLAIVPRHALLPPPSANTPLARGVSAVASAAAAAAAALRPGGSEEAAPWVWPRADGGDMWHARPLTALMPERAAWVAERYCDASEAAERAEAVAAALAAASPAEREPGESARRRTIWVSGIPHQLGESEVVDLFSCAGEVQFGTVVKQSRSSHNVFAFLEYDCPAAADAALQLGGLLFGKIDGCDTALRVQLSRSAISKSALITAEWHRIQKRRCALLGGETAPAPDPPGKRRHPSLDEELPTKRPAPRRSRSPAAAPAAAAADAFLSGLGGAAEGRAMATARTNNSPQASADNSRRVNHSNTNHAQGGVDARLPALPSSS